VRGLQNAKPDRSSRIGRSKTQSKKTRILLRNLLIEDIVKEKFLKILGNYLRLVITRIYPVRVIIDAHNK
jgi:hypothetical protein